MKSVGCNPTWPRFWQRLCILGSGVRSRAFNGVRNREMEREVDRAVGWLEYTAWCKVFGVGQSPLFCNWHQVLVDYFVGSIVCGP